MSIEKNRSDSQIHDMFGRISKRYDFLNHLLSFGLDFSWRRKAVKLLNVTKDAKIIDLASGTGDLLIALLKEKPDLSRCIGFDISAQMLDICKRKLHENKIAERAELIQGDMRDTGLAENSFDAATIAFGIRNTSDVIGAIKEIHRILKPRGQVVILEFSMPQKGMISALYFLYLRYIMPLTAWIFGADKSAYRYLDTSVEGFYKAEEFCELMKEANFTNVAARKLTFGAVYLYQGFKNDKI